MNRLFLLVLLIAEITSVSGADRILNHASPKTVFDITFERYNVWVATSGGLYWYDMKKDKFSLRPSDASFPDPAIRTLVVDPKGRVWAGSYDGYLLRRDPDGNEYINRAYESAQWKILDMVAYGDYLIIGSDKGVSLYDTRKNVVVKNSSKIASFTSSLVNLVTIHKNRLYIGCELGQAVLRGSVKDIDERNFYDPTIWEIDSSVNFSVRGFSTYTGKIEASDKLVGFSNGLPVSADSNSVTFHHPEEDGSIYLPSNITCLSAQGDNHVWIGTENDYCYLWGWDGTLTPIVFGGPSFSGISRLLLDKGGDLWALPFVDQRFMQEASTPWWHGINRYTGNVWKVYSPKEYPGMGHLGGEGDALGILEDSYGNVWFGMTGGGIKRYNANADIWYHYCNYGKDYFNGAFLRTQGTCLGGKLYDWGKCDAIAQDSSGYVWISSWNNYHGALICYKPVNDKDTLLGALDSVQLEFASEYDSLVGQYRRLPPNGSDAASVNVTAIAADAYGNIIYGMEKGRVTVIRYNGDPVKDKNSVYQVKSFSGLPKVKHITVLPDGNSLVLTAAGVYRFDPSDTTLVLLENFDKNITSLSLESENIYWYGTPSEGLVRYDVVNDEKTYYNKASGLVSDKINDVVVDQGRGRVWVATDQGVSQLELGYTATASKKGAEQVYPNPYSFRRNSLIHFQNLPADGELRIYSLDGTLVSKPEMVRSSEKGAYYNWKPSTSCSPGTYFYTYVAGTVKTNGKLMLVP